MCERCVCGSVALWRCVHPAPACMCGVEGSRPQPLTQASALKKTQNLGKPAQLHTVTISTDYCVSLSVIPIK